jgi:hypothetical protein
LRKVPKWVDKGALPNANVLSSMAGYPTGYSGDSDVPKNSPKKLTTARDYYIGVFPVIQNPFAAVGMRRSRVPVGWWCVAGRGAASSPSPFPFS